MSNIPLREWIKKYNAGAFKAGDRVTQSQAGWFDWFCKDIQLVKRLEVLAPKVIKVAKSPKINIDKSYVQFKNNCPFNGRLYDDFRIFHLESGNALYTVTPFSGHKASLGQAEVWGRENGFVTPLVRGYWKDVAEFFKI